MKIIITNYNLRQRTGRVATAQQRQEERQPKQQIEQQPEQQREQQPEQQREQQRCVQPE